MLDRTDLLEKDTQNLHTKLLELPGSYTGPQTQMDAPYSGVAYGEASLALALCEEWVTLELGKTGTQFVLSSGLDFGEAQEFTNLSEIREVNVKRVGLAATLGDLSFMVARGPLSTYTYAQYLAHATGHSADAVNADAALQDLAQRCRIEIPTEDNPAKKLAWTLWTRTPLLLASRDYLALTWGWQELLARIGKSMSFALTHSPLLLLSGGFEARHETGDERVAVLLGPMDAEMILAREILGTRVDEALEVPFPDGLEGYAGQMYLWSLGAWTAFYLALAYGQDPADSPVLTALLESEGLEVRDDLELN